MNYVAFCHVFVGFHCFNVVLQYILFREKSSKGQDFRGFALEDRCFPLQYLHMHVTKNGHNKAMNKRQSKVFAV